MDAKKIADALQTRMVQKREKCSTTYQIAPATSVLQTLNSYDYRAVLYYMKNPGERRAKVLEASRNRLKKAVDEYKNPVVRVRSVLGVHWNKSGVDFFKETLKIARSVIEYFFIISDQNDMAQCVQHNFPVLSQIYEQFVLLFIKDDTFLKTDGAGAVGKVLRLFTTLQFPKPPDDLKSVSSSERKFFENQAELQTYMEKIQENLTSFREDKDEGKKYANLRTHIVRGADLFQSSCALYCGKIIPMVFKYYEDTRKTGLLVKLQRGRNETPLSYDELLICTRYFRSVERVLDVEVPHFEKDYEHMMYLLRKPQPEYVQKLMNQAPLKKLEDSKKQMGEIHDQVSMEKILGKNLGKLFHEVLHSKVSYTVSVLMGILMHKWSKPHVKWHKSKPFRTIFQYFPFGAQPYHLPKLIFGLLETMSRHDSEDKSYTELPNNKKYTTLKLIFYARRDRGDFPKKLEYKDYTFIRAIFDRLIVTEIDTAAYKAIQEMKEGASTDQEFAEKFATHVKNDVTEKPLIARFLKIITGNPGTLSYISQVENGLTFNEKSRSVEQITEQIIKFMKSIYLTLGEMYEISNQNTMMKKKKKRNKKSKEGSKTVKETSPAINIERDRPRSTIRDPVPEGAPAQATVPNVPPAQRTVQDAKQTKVVDLTGSEVKASDQKKPTFSRLPSIPEPRPESLPRESGIPSPYTRTLVSAYWGVDERSLGDVSGTQGARDQHQGLFEYQSTGYSIRGTVSHVDLTKTFGFITIDQEYIKDKPEGFKVIFFMGTDVQKDYELKEGDRVKGKVKYHTGIGPRATTLTKYYIQGEQLNLEESPTLEYKQLAQFNIQKRESINTMCIILKRYICSFLNSKGGRLVLGVTDERLVRGIDVPDSKAKDFIQYILLQSLRTFIPVVSPDAVKINYIDVMGGRDGKSTERCVVEVLVSPVKVAGGHRINFFTFKYTQTSPGRSGVGRSPLFPWVGYVRQGSSSTVLIHSEYEERVTEFLKVIEQDAIAAKTTR